MKILRTDPIRRPKELKKKEKHQIEKILKDNEHLLTKEEKRIYKKELGI
jgi:hypothetical protein